MTEAGLEEVNEKLKQLGEALKKYIEYCLNFIFSNLA